MTNPIDLMQVFVRPSMGVGQRLGMDKIDRRLSGLPLRLVMELLGQVNCYADQSINRHDRQRELVDRFFPVTFQRRLHDLLDADPNLVPVSSQVVANLAVRALVICPDRDYTTEEIDDTARVLGALTLAVAEYVMEGAHDEKDLALAFARMALYFRLNDLSSWYEVARRLLFETLPSLAGHVDYVDADAVCQAVYGLDLEVLWALTVAFGTAAQTNTDFYLVPPPIQGGVLDDETITRWSHVWMVPLEESRALAQSDLDAGTWWSFSSFFDHPVIAITPNRGVAIRPAFLAQKATPAGMFWVVRNAFVAAGGNHEQWARLFGVAVETLARHLIAELASGGDILANDDALRTRWGPGKVCDTVLLGRTWVAIDFVHRQLTKASASTGDFDDLARDLRLAAVDKLEQIDEALQRGLAIESPPDAIIPLVVVGAPFPTSPLVMKHIEEALGPRSVIGSNPTCSPPAVIDLSEFHVLLQVANAQKRDVAEILHQWLASEMGRDSFRSWLTTDGPGREIPGGGAISAEWMKVIRARLYGPAAAEDDSVLPETT
jgi:hypothetical protein